MQTPLIKIQIPSIYKVNNTPVLLPEHMAWCTPDMYYSIHSVSNELKAIGGDLVLSDLFRNYNMQLQAYLDWKSKKKTAFSPPPGGSMHEAGRAMDIDLDKTGVGLDEFWQIAGKYGFKPIIRTPDKNLPEFWHFDCRGSHGKVYNYYLSGKASNMPAYTAMAVSAILALGLKVDRFADRSKEAFIQTGLIRLGFDPGAIDGSLGVRSKAALQKVDILFGPLEYMVAEIEHKLQNVFPEEFMAVKMDFDDDEKPDYIL